MVVDKNKDKISLQFVIAKVKAIAADQYENKIYDNVLSIFNQLTTVEKRVLLKGLINICFIVEDKVLADNVSMSDVKEAVVQGSQVLKGQVTDIDNFNKLEMIKLKSWLIKTAAIVMMVGVMVVITASVVLSSDDSRFVKSFLEWKKIFSLILGF